MGRWKERKKEAQSAKARRRMEYDYWGGGQWRGVVWKRNSTSQVNPRGSDGDGEGRGRGSASAPAEDAGEGMWTGVVSGRNWNGGAVAPGSPALSLARPCSCPVSALSVPLAGRRSQGRQAIAFRYNGKRDRSVETERGRAFALAGWVGERESEPDVLSGASSD